MSQFTQKKCPTCGGRLELVSGNSYECRSCHNVYELNERNANLYHDIELASTFRESLNFKQAELLYKKLLKEYAQDNLTDVYWNLLLCEQRVMFETDQNGEQFPSFYDISATEIDESEYYGETISYANKFNPANIHTYVNLVNKMHLAKKQYKTIKETTKPYDIFICFKKSSIKDPSKLTKDYQLAMDLYNKLNDDYRVFFSERSLNNIVVREYEPNIYHALYTAKIMIVICSQKAYINSQWMKNEWSRFKMMSNTTSQAKSIIPIFRNNFQPEQLPDELRSCQGIKDDMSLLYNLTQAVKAILNPVDREAELAAKIRAEMEERMQAQMKAFAEQFTARNKPIENHTTVKEDWSKYDGDYDGVYYDPTDGCYHEGKPSPEIAAKLAAVRKRSKATSVTPQNKTAHNAVITAKPIVPYLVVPAGTTNIKPSQFENCMDLKDIAIPNGVLGIPYHAFAYCTNLKSIVIPNSVKYIEEGAFYNCTALTKIEGASGVTRIFGTDAFFKTPWFNDQPNGVVYIGKVAYKYKGKMSETSITLINGTTSISSDLLKNYASLTSISIPSSVKHIGSLAFAHCTNLVHIYYNGTKRDWNTIEKYKELNFKYNWDYKTGKYTVHCTDGDLSKKQS